MKLETKDRNPETGPLLGPTTIVGAVFAHSGLETFPKDDKFIQDFFRKSKQRHRYSNLLQNFIFDEVSIYPYSCRLDEALGRLRLAGSLTWTYSGGGRAPKYWLGQKEREGWIELALKYDSSEKTQKLLKELGKKFKKAAKKFCVEEKRKIEKSLIHPRKKKFITIFASKK